MCVQIADTIVTEPSPLRDAATDLPWRYTPRLPSGGELRPWVVLVVGPGRAGRLGQPGEFPLQRGHPLPRAGPRGQQQVPLWLHGPNL